jgi:hypothetical protein
MILKLKVNVIYRTNKNKLEVRVIYFNNLSIKYLRKIMKWLRILLKLLNKINVLIKTICTVSIRKIMIFNMFLIIMVSKL